MIVLVIDPEVLVLCPPTQAPRRRLLPSDTTWGSVLAPSPQFTVSPFTSVPWKLRLLLTDLYFFSFEEF